MRKFYLALLGCVALAGHVQAQSDVIRARWKSAGIVIDGNDGEWKKPLNLYDDKSGILYAIANDKNTLYFDFTVSDRMKMRKMMTAGWSVELISKEKRNKFKASLIFPPVKLLGAMRRRNPDQMGERERGNSSVRSYEMMLGKVALKGFRSNQTETKLRNKAGIDIAVGENTEKQLVYEVAIPLKDLFAANTIHLNELINLNVNVNAFTRPSEGGGSRGGFEGEMGRPGGRSRMGGGMRGGGGRMGGGMSGFREGGGEMRGGGREGGFRGGEGNGDRSAMFAKASFKQKFKLTDN